MRAVSLTERRSQGYYRHELRTLTYVTIEDGNGGIVRNLNRHGAAVQAVGALRSQQRVRLRFEVRFPRLRIDAYGQVIWASPTGQCGIRFLDLPANIRAQIDQWIFSNLLEAMAREVSRPRSMFAPSNFASPVVSVARARTTAGPEVDGLTMSAAVRTAFSLRPNSAHMPPTTKDTLDPADGDRYGESSAHKEAAFDVPDPLPRLLSGQTLAWVIDGLVVLAALLIFAFIFLSIAHELPPWPLSVLSGLAAAAFVTGAYWSVFTLFQGLSLGQSLASIESDENATASSCGLASEL